MPLDIPFYRTLADKAGSMRVAVRFRGCPDQCAKAMICPNDLQPSLSIAEDPGQPAMPRLGVYCLPDLSPKRSFAGVPAEEHFDADVTAGLDESGPRMVIGRYHLLQRIGEGGMGEVWLAEQKEPVRRRVALKLVKAGMNTREAIARFDSERQALALMDHPAIAKVFDAGSTTQGAPYFVMEYVAGVAITSYCDNHR